MQRLLMLSRHAPYLRPMTTLSASAPAKQFSSLSQGSKLKDGHELAYFAGGCFWGVEYGFTKVNGVERAVSGYQQGKTENPTYEQICTGKTGHTESVLVEFNAKEVEFAKLCKFFVHMIDPTTLNMQGWDVGTQYRSGIYCTSQ